MQITTLIENTGLETRTDLLTEHGLSLLIQSDGQRILFDTGLTGSFHRNAPLLGVDTAAVTHAVLSHHHFDHGGGLATFLDANRQASVYLRTASSEDLSLNVFNLFKRQVGLDTSLFSRHPGRFVFLDQLTEIASGAFVLTRIAKRHPTPTGNRHLYAGTGAAKKLDDFDHELILVLRQEAGLVVFTGCSHHGILNMLDAVLEHFPGQPIRAVFGGFHLIDLPFLNTMAGSRRDVENLGRAILKYPVEKVYTGHCTGLKAYPILKGVMGDRLEYLATGSRVEL